MSGGDCRSCRSLNGTGRKSVYGKCEGKSFILKQVLVSCPWQMLNLTHILTRPGKTQVATWQACGLWEGERWHGQCGSHRARTANYHWWPLYPAKQPTHPACMLSVPCREWVSWCTRALSVFLIPFKSNYEQKLNKEKDRKPCVQDPITTEEKGIQHSCHFPSNTAFMVTQKIKRPPVICHPLCCHFHTHFKRLSSYYPYSLSNRSNWLMKGTCCVFKIVLGAEYFSLGATYKGTFWY